MMYKKYTLLEPIEVGRDELFTPRAKWAKTGDIWGLMDYQSGDNRQDVHRTFHPDSTHVFITDGMPEYAITVFHQLVSQTGDKYLIHYVDNVSEVDDHLEVYCKKMGDDHVHI